MWAWCSDAERSVLQTHSRGCEKHRSPMYMPHETGTCDATERSVCAADMPSLYGITARFAYREERNGVRGWH